MQICNPTGQREIVRRTKEQSEQTRQHIMRAARREFARHGVTRTTLERVAAEADVTRGAVYWHFANKRDLFRSMRDQVSLPLFDRAELPDGDDPDPLLGVERFLNGVIDQVAGDRQTRQTFDILSLKCEYVDEFRSELKRHTQRCHELMLGLADVYGRARGAGMLREGVVPDQAALGTCVFITGLLRLWLMDSDGTLLRMRAHALIADHIAALRAPVRPSGRLRDRA